MEKEHVIKRNFRREGPGNEELSTENKDGNGASLDPKSAGFRPSEGRVGLLFAPWVFGFRGPKQGGSGLGSGFAFPQRVPIGDRNRGGSG